MNIPVIQARSPLTWTITVKKAGVAADISDFVTLTIRVKAPSGTITELTPTFSTDGTNGNLAYTNIHHVHGIGDVVLSGRLGHSTVKCE